MPPASHAKIGASARLAATAVALALAVTGCSDGGDDKPDDTESSAAEFEQPTVDLTVGTADLISPHQAKGPLDAATADAVTDVVEELLLTTSARPLGLGEAGTGFANLFTLAAGAQAAGTDHDVFFDDDLPEFGELVAEEATLTLTALAGTVDPATALVIAKYRWNVRSADRPADRIVREGELHLIPDGQAWKIGAYTIVVTRTIAERTTTTTATTR